MGNTAAVGPHLTTGIATAGVGILAMGLVAVTPDVAVARTDVRSLQLVASARASSAPPLAILAKLVSDQVHAVVPPIRAVAAGQDVTTVAVTPRLASGGSASVTAVPVQEARAPSLIYAAPNRERVDTAAPAAADTALPPGADIGDFVKSVFAGALLVALVVVGVPVFYVVIFATSAVNVVLDALGLPLLPNVPDPPFGPIPEPPAATVPLGTTTPSLSGIALPDPQTADLRQPDPGQRGIATDQPASGRHPVAAGEPTLGRRESGSGRATSNPEFVPNRRSAPSSAEQIGRIETARPRSTEKGTGEATPGGPRRATARAESAERGGGTGEVTPRKHAGTSRTTSHKPANRADAPQARTAPAAAS